MCTLPVPAMGAPAASVSFALGTLLSAAVAADRTEPKHGFNNLLATVRGRIARALTILALANKHRDTRPAAVVVM